MHPLNSRNKYSNPAGKTTETYDKYFITMLEKTHSDLESNQSDRRASVMVKNP